MKNKLAWMVVFTFGLALALASAHPGFAQERKDDMGMPIAEPPADPIEREAWSLALAITRAEGEQFGRTHTYVSFDKLMGAHPLAGKTALAVSVGPDGELSGKLKGHFLRLLVSPDGRYYLLSITPEVGGCGFGMFTDETGAIYTSPGLDCRE